MRHPTFLIALLLVTAPCLTFGKHPAPQHVGAVTNNGVSYVVPNDKGLRAYVEAWDAQTGKKLWTKTILRHYFIPPFVPLFGTECLNYEYLVSMVLQNDVLALTSDGGRLYTLDIRTRAVRRVKAKKPNKPDAPNTAMTPCSMAPGCGAVSVIRSVRICYDVVTSPRREFGDRGMHECTSG